MRSLIGATLLVGALAACSSSAKTAQPSSSSTSTGPTTPTTTAPVRCTPPGAGTPAVATKVAGIASDWTLTSFDSTAIRMHWFAAPTATAAHRVPTVLMGPGWGQAGDTNTSAAGLFGSVGIGALQKAGYNVLTWDPRGFGQSTGTVESDSPDFEGRDVEKMLDWVSTQPGVLLDGPGDPRAGMAGGSYGGGIQLVTAAIDCRVDAIAPMIAWHSLTTSLFKADTPKNGWSGLLTAAAAGRKVDPHIPHSYHAATTTEIIDQADRAWFASRGPGDLVNRISIPTLIIQGTVDNLFTLDEGITNYRILRDRGVPTAMLWFCGGHGVCLTNPGDPTRVGTALMAWLDRYVKRDTTVDTGPRFDFVDQNGKRYTADDYPVPVGTPIVATGSGTLRLVADGGSGPAHPAAGSKDPLAGIAAGITPGKATNAVNVAVKVTTTAVVLGAPQLTLSYSGTVPAGVRPTRVFAQLVDDATGVVVGNQVTPFAVTLDGKSHTVSVPLEVVAYTAHPGSTLTLQLVATTTAYAQPRLGGSVTFDKIDLRLPVAGNLNPQ
ncbi:MAG TPA: alpha/beta fold hydrolase [Acidimicrobiia bacterium]|jgi:ABC-2 type transport system ATP-binding protein|nr:alpha/beta fold hydrolase [Acidimicrobiia bacterium]